jgi:hypothetical protein
MAGTTHLPAVWDLILNNDPITGGSGFDSIINA